MKTIIKLTLSTFLLVAFLQSANAQVIDSPLLPIEKERLKAQGTADEATLRRVLAPELTYNHSNGASDNLEAFLESLTSGRVVYKTFEFESFSTKLYKKTAVNTVVVKLVVVISGNPVDLKLRFTDVYVKRGKQWQMVSWHSTKL